MRVHAVPINFQGSFELILGFRIPVVPRGLSARFEDEI